MIEDLPQRLRDIAATVSDWDAPICARADLHAAAREIEELRNELEHHVIVEAEMIRLREQSLKGYTK